MTERDLPSDRTQLRELYGQNPAVQRAAQFLVNLQAFKIGDKDVLEIPIEGTDMTTTTIPQLLEVDLMEIQVREHLTQLCGGDRELGLDIRDRFLFKFFDDNGLWPSDDEEK